jgi:hypothetical protein
LTALSLPYRIPRKKIDAGKTTPHMYGPPVRRYIIGRHRVV